MALLATTADSAQFWRIGQNWLYYLARPFHTLFARISCNTLLESLKHTVWILLMMFEILFRIASALCVLDYSSYVVLG